MLICEVNMIQDRLDQIETTVQGASNIPDDAKAQLLSLIGDLKKEVVALAATHSDEAEAIARHTESTTLEATATGEGKEPEKMDAALTGLTGSVSGFEATHPRLTQLVNRLADTLSNVGI